MFDSIPSQKIRNFRQHKLGPIVGHQLLWEAICRKDVSQDVDDFLSSGTHHLDNFWPHRMCINYDQETLSQKGARKVNVDPLPRLGWPCPRVQRGHSWSRQQDLAI